jgi:hypothetical protein
MNMTAIDVASSEKRGHLCIAIWCVATLLAVSTVHAANLIENPGFDADVADWTPRPGTVIEWSSTDQLGSFASGSMALSTPASGGLVEIGARRCVPVSPGTTYAFGMGARIIPNPGLVEPRAYLSVTWSPGAGCNDPVLSFNLSDADVTIVGVWGTAQGWATAPEGALSASLQMRVIAEDNPGPSFRANLDNVFFLQDASCGPSPNTLCLNQDRFRVIVEWETNAGDAGYGQAVPLTDDSGYFWFFNDANVELVTKLLDACPTQFDRFWFFAAGLTDVLTTIRVTDTGSNTEREYVNPQQTPFAPIQDTDAFATCP